MIENGKGKRLSRIRDFSKVGGLKRVASCYPSDFHFLWVTINRLCNNEGVGFYSNMRDTGAYGIFLFP